MLRKPENNEAEDRILASLRNDSKKKQVHFLLQLYSSDSSGDPNVFEDKIAALAVFLLLPPE